MTGRVPPTHSPKKPLFFISSTNWSRLSLKTLAMMSGEFCGRQWGSNSSSRLSHPKVDWWSWLEICLDGQCSDKQQARLENFAAYTSSNL